MVWWVGIECRSSDRGRGSFCFIFLLFNYSCPHSPPQKEHVRVTDIEGNEQNVDKLDI